MSRFLKNFDLISNFTSVILHGPALIEAKVEDNNNGTYKVTYTPEVKGIYDVFVGINGTQIGKSPFTAIISPGVVHAQQCIATGKHKSLRDL